MCGIIGYTGPRKTAKILLEGLRRLEYRGYDSAGIAVGRENAEPRLEIIKSVGKIAELAKKMPEDIDGSWGIGHTRWATHGGVTEANAHPHTDMSGKIVVVHNGIIENHKTLRTMLGKKGVVFKSETDTEVIPHLIASYYEGDLLKAVLAALQHLEGTYGIACIHANEPGRIVGARNGSPLIVGVGNDEMFLASDITAMVAYTNRVIYLNDGEVVDITRDSYTITDRHSNMLDKQVDEITWELGAIEKSGFMHYMEKEIFEQPDSIARAMSGRIDEENATAKLGGLNLSRRQLADVHRVRIIAAGTSWHAGMTGSYLLEQAARIPAQAELASELRYRNPVVENDSLWFVVSQSGETADSLYAMREVQRKGATVLGICNVVGSTIARESDGGVYVHSGPEIAVASTKAFTSQLTAFYLFTLLMARMRDMSREEGQKFTRSLLAVPEMVRDALAQRDHIQAIAKKYCRAKDFLYLGRGILYPIALEGALKLKEISYIHAEGYSAGEMKHGPIALISPEVPSVFLVSDDYLHEKTISNIREIKARGGPIIAVGVEGDTEAMALADDFIAVPKADPRFYPFSMVVPLQLFAYFCALELGRDVDQPRNLAKSVTVE
ncbi:MAG TPA: glutamine--fructose-6-phosphate transaminase (isomerizing) [Spirochaetaceae bacterium]|uniref:glutamine--fructose-6-phosphate transaminase (isomerizing) n=1 Tax=Rectinema subterraneum TaxID=2653714 RepID=UPI000EE3D59F|nr:glutamine--fructose-6-phosphate transaminase (isomerizing) [Rectinema subterraneum]HCX96660.1 glutamine--fructose-6-phosphate transaminase (isomerizing) [Spirochaetaceae bacterium]